MAFKISSSSTRPKKLSKCVSAFDDEDDEFTAVPRPHQQAASGGGVPDTSSSSPGKPVEVAAAEWISKGSAYAEDGDDAAALRCWDQALLVQPDNARIHEMRAQVLNAQQGQAYDALQAAQQAVKLCPDWAEAHITLARVQLNFGEPQLALQSYQAAARLQPGHPDVVSELASAQMYAKLHAQQQQQHPGSRAHVVSQQEQVDQQVRQENTDYRG